MGKHGKRQWKKACAAALAAVLVLGLTACGRNEGNEAAKSSVGAPSGQEMPSMPNGEFPGGELPSMPNGEFPGGEMPSMPNGEFPGGELPSMPNGEMPSALEGGDPGMSGENPGQGGWNPGGMRPGGDRPGQGGSRPGQNGGQSGNWNPGQQGTTGKLDLPDLSEAKVEVPESVTGEFRITTADGSFTQDGSTFTVTKGGTYVLSGILSDGQVVVDAGEDEVELDMNGAAVICSYDSPVYVKNAGKVKIKAMAGTENLVNDTRAKRTDENDAAGAGAVYATCDLNLLGTGSLTVVSTYNNGVHTKDDLKIKNLTLSVAAVNNALKGNDSVTVESGTLKVLSTGGDGIKTENNDVSSKGNQRGDVTVTGGTLEIRAATDAVDAAHDILVRGGSLTIEAGDDGLHAENDLKIAAGTVTVEQSHEGLEGHYVTVSGGTVTVYASDDGVNATGSDGFSNDGLITVTGGKLYVEVTGRDVDGLDANGSYKQTGGFVFVSNPYADASGNMSATDVAGTMEVTGGVILALGTVPNQGGGIGGWGGFFGKGGMGGMFGTAELPDGAVTIDGTLEAGTHTFTYGSVTESFTLKSAVSGGWIWAAGISSDNYGLN